MTNRAEDTAPTDHDAWSEWETGQYNAPRFTAEARRAGLTVVDGDEHASGLRKSFADAANAYLAIRQADCDDNPVGFAFTPVARPPQPDTRNTSSQSPAAAGIPREPATPDNTYTKDNLPFMPTWKVAALIAQCKISPTQVTNLLLERIARLDKRLGAFLDVFGAAALDDARVLEQEAQNGTIRGPLHGVPIAVKDIIDCSNTITTCGSQATPRVNATRDATVIRHLRRAGAIILGKTNLAEFALGATGVNPYTGTTRNPWNAERVTAGSSSGSAAAVAAGLAYAALGSDTGGSIRMPAALCGVAGLKPTYGTVSNCGVYSLSWSLDTVGPIARSVADCAIMLNVLAGYAPHKHDSERTATPVKDYTARLGMDIANLRIGIPKHYFFEDVDPEINAAVMQAVTQLEQAGAQVREITMPWASLGRAINLGIMLPEAVTVHAKSLANSGTQYGEQVRYRMQSGYAIPTADYLRAQRARLWFAHKMTDAMADVDVLITPTTPVAAPTIAECTPAPTGPGVLLPLFTGVFNTTGQPSLSVNCGTTEDGMPTGMMITAHAFEDDVALQVGHAWEEMSSEPAGYNMNSAIAKWR